MIRRREDRNYATVAIHGADLTLKLLLQLAKEYGTTDIEIRAETDYGDGWDECAFPVAYAHVYNVTTWPPPCTHQIVQRIYGQSICVVCQTKVEG